MSFYADKKTALSKPDKSTAGKIDEAIKPLCDLINSSPNYFTTSSCAGRIVVMSEPEDHKKNEAEWLFISHKTVDFNTVKARLDPLPQQPIWLREEGMILHVACKTHEDAFKLIEAAQKAGLKRSGVISAAKKIIVEIFDTERLELPMAVKGQFIVTEEYLTFVLGVANKKLKRTRRKIKRLEENLEQLFS
jgi:tRNA wybutosine-synthesizing protein 3